MVRPHFLHVGNSQDSASVGSDKMTDYGKSAFTDMSRIVSGLTAKALVGLASVILWSCASSTQPEAWPTRQEYLLAITMPPDMLFDVKSGQPVSPDSWVLVKSTDESPPWHHTDVFAKESEVRAKALSEVYRTEYGWTGELPPLSGQTPARYWFDEMIPDTKKDCPTSTFTIISETGLDADGGSEIIFELNRVGCSNQDNDQIVRAMVEARGNNHPVFQFSYLVKGQMTEAERQHAIERVRSHRLLSKPWPEDQRYMAVKFRVS